MEQALVACSKPALRGEVYSLRSLRLPLVWSRSHLGVVSWVTVAAIFLSNIPGGLSSAAGMKKAGRSICYIFGVWGAIAVISGIAALLGYTVLGRFSGEVTAATTAVAAGGILAAISDSMIPEAFEETHDFAGLITVCGFLAAFVLSKLAER